MKLHVLPTHAINPEDLSAILVLDEHGNVLFNFPFKTRDAYGEERGKSQAEKIVALIDAAMWVFDDAHDRGETHPDGNPKDLFDDWKALASALDALKPTESGGDPE